MSANKQMVASLKKEVKDKIPPNVTDESLSDLISNIVIEIMSERIDVMVNQTLNSLVRDTFLQNLVQDKVFAGMQGILEREVRVRASDLVSETDLGSVISDKVSEFVRDRMKNSNLPKGFIPWSAINTSSIEISPDSITPGTIRSFSSTGIEDTANSVQLTVMDGVVVAEGRIISNDLSVEQSARIRKLEVQDELRIKGEIVFENPSFSEQVRSLVETKVADDWNDRQIDLSGKALLSNGKELLSDSSLGLGVIFSNLRKVGNLQDLNVIGRLSAADTIVAADGRFGINTDDPAGALTIWDEEAELTVKKYRNKTMYVGSTRDCDMVFGVSDKVNLAIRKDGSVSMKTLDLASIKISTSDKVPEREGTLGELVIMTDVKPSLPWAYQCMGGKSWTALKR